MSYLYDQMKKFKANGIVPKTCPKQPLYKLASCKHIQNLAKKEEIKKFEEWLNELREVYDKYDQCMAATASEIPIGKDKAKKRCGRIASIQERHIIRRGKLNELKF